MGQGTGFALGDQRVWFRSSEDLSMLEDGSVDLFVTSVPYWNTKDYGVEGQIGAENYPSYLDRLERVWQECWRVGSDSSVLIVNVGHVRRAKTYYPISHHIAARSGPWELWDQLMWFIPNALPQPSHYRESLFDSKYEPVLVFTRAGGREPSTFNKVRIPHAYGGDPRPGKINPDGRCLGNILRIPAYRPPNIRAMGYHQAAMPEELAALLVHVYSNEGGLVCDPFLGSGTTLKVARNLGRRGVGVELDAGNEELIRSRISEEWSPPPWQEVDAIRPVTKRSSPRR